MKVQFDCGDSLLGALLAVILGVAVVALQLALLVGLVVLVWRWAL